MTKLTRPFTGDNEREHGILNRKLAHYEKTLQSLDDKFSALPEDSDKHLVKQYKVLVM